jgi:inner membrane protein
MDNICHTLVGVAAARAGFNTKTAFATATLAISANIPDLDVLAFATGIPAVALRRGWTHGPIAQALLPIGFALLVHAYGRKRGSPTQLGWLIALSYLGVLSHVFLDYLNSYGVRLLMPFTHRWFYGDALFIIDPWLWLVLGAGAFFAGVRRRWPARAGLALSTVYIVAMLVSARAARSIVEDRWVEAMGSAPLKLMVGPVPIDPFRKSIIVDTGDAYMRGEFSWYPRSVRFDPQQLPKNNRSPLIDAARAQEPDFDAVLSWSRFPFWRFAEEGDRIRVSLRDARFPDGQRGFGATTTVPAGKR